MSQARSDGRRRSCRPSVAETSRACSRSPTRRSSGTRSFAELGQGGVYQGHDGTRQYLSDLDDAWEIVRADVDDGIGIGEVAILIGRIHYRGKASGIETESAAGWMLKFRQGKVVCFRAFREPEQALERVGLSE
jgi:ketosteroid isomerase-like protein